MPSILDQILRDTGVDLPDEYEGFIPEYDPQREQFATRQAGIRGDQITGQRSLLEDLFQTQQSGFRAGREQARFGAQNTLFDVMQQGQSQLGQSGFARSGGIEQAVERSAGQARTRYGFQMGDISRQQRQGKIRYGEQMSDLQRQQMMIDLGLEESIYGYQQDYRERVMDRLIDLMQSGADLTGTPFGEGTGGSEDDPLEDPGGKLPGADAGGGGLPDDPSTDTGPGTGDALFDFGPLSDVTTSNWTAQDWTNWYANWYSENNNGFGLSVLQQGADNWSPADWQGWYDTQFGNPNPFN